MWECNKKHDTPIDIRTKLQKAEPGYEPKLAEVKWYQRAVGSLMYAMLTIGVDHNNKSFFIAFAFLPDQTEGSYH
jgi:hypothetical protein